MAVYTYPLAVTAGLEVSRFNRVLADAFEDGSGSTRRLWANKTFKRRFRIQHAPLLAVELETLEGFYSQRNGPYDSFWFRDNVNRRGNAEVRFSGPLRFAQRGGERIVEVELEEIAPIVQNPSLYELKLATQNSPVWWWDANRVLYYTHVNPLAITLENTIDCGVGTYKPVWTPGALLPRGSSAQWQYFRPQLNFYARTNETIPLTGGTQPGFTLFAFVRHSTSATKQVIAGVGTLGTGKAMGLVLSAANIYEPWLGGSEAWATAVQANTPADTWRSIGVMFTPGTNDVSMVVNGVLVGTTNANPKDFSNGTASIGAAMDGTLPVNSTGLMVNSDSQHVIAFNASLSPTHIKEIHNLFAYQFGLPTVA